MNTSPEFNAAYATASSRITSASDGPVDAFVAVARAIAIARASGSQSEVDDPIANALYDVMESHGWLGNGRSIQSRERG